MSILVASLEKFNIVSMANDGFFSIQQRHSVMASRTIKVTVLKGKHVLSIMQKLRKFSNTNSRTFSAIITCSFILKFAHNIHKTIS